MKQALLITFHGLERSDALEDDVRRRCTHLERFASDIMSCRVVVDRLQTHQRQGCPFGVRIALTVSGHELVANRVRHEDVYIAVRDAFEDMQRQLEDWVRRRRGDEKQHATRPPLPD